MIHFNVKTEMDDYKEKCWYVFSHTLSYRIYTCLVILIALIYLVVLAWHEQSLSEYVFAIVVVFVLAVMALKFLKISCMGLAERRKGFPENTEISLSEEGIHLKTSTTEVFVNWVEVVRIRVPGKYILFDMQQQHLYAIQKQLVSNEVLDSIMTFLKEDETIAAKIESYTKKRAFIEKIYNSIISHM